MLTLCLLWITVNQFVRYEQRPDFNSVYFTIHRKILSEVSVNWLS